MNLYLISFVTIFIIWEILFKKTKYKVKTKPELYTLLAIGVSFVVFQQSGIMALISAPNPGYVNAVNVGSIGVVTLLSAIIFKDDLSLKKSIWVAGIIISIIFLFI